MRKKRYNTKRRKQERQKWIALAIATGIGLMGLGISYISTITPIMAQSTGGIYKAPEKPEIEELTIQEHVWKLLTEEGELSYEEALDGMMIVNLESRWDNYAIGDSGHSVGLWQIHKPSHPDITTECRIDVYCSTRAAIKIYEAWGGWYAWSTYKLIK